MGKKVKMTHALFVFCSLFFTVVLVFSPAAAQEVEDEHEFSYDPESETGPKRWGELRPEWSACGNGTMQSPIDLSHERVKTVSYLGRLKKNYMRAPATLKNRGHDMMLEWKGEGGAGYITVRGERFTLRQCHWHSPSEHTLNEKRFKLELHMVHESASGDVAVVGIVYKYGRPDTFLSKLRPKLEEVAGNNETETAAGEVNPKGIKIGSRKYYRYIGSLTTPPCTQNVTWTIVRKVRTVTRDQVKLLRVAVHDEADSNARPLQALNNREVLLYRPDDKKHERP